MSKRIITRTIYGAHLQKHLVLNIPYAAPENTTLNEKFGIGTDETLPVNTVPKFGYFCIGDKGHRVRTGADGISYTSPVNHRATDAALFHHLPFILRPEAEDIPIAKRSHYGLRRIEQHHGERHVAYYLKRIDTSTVASQLLHTTIRDGVTTNREFIPTVDNLNPEPPEVPNQGVITTEGDSVSTTSILTIHFDEWDVAELVNVARILYDNEERALISEIGICSGVDKVLTATSPHGQFNYNEVVSTQIVTFVTGYYPVGFTNQGFTFQIDAGATEPLLSIDTGN